MTHHTNIDNLAILLDRVSEQSTMNTIMRAILTQKKMIGLLPIIACLALLASGCATPRMQRPSLELVTKEIIIPEIELLNANLWDVIEFLHESSIIYGDGTHGINIILKPQEPGYSRCITMKARNLSLYEAVVYTAECSGLRVRVDGNALVLCDPSDIGKHDNVLVPSNPPVESDDETVFDEPPVADRHRDDRSVQESESMKPYGGQFHDAIKGATRIVVREGCYYYRFDANEKPIPYASYFAVTNPEEIERVSRKLAFKGVDYALCDCGGDPGIDWYKDREKLVMTSSKHGGRIVWKNEEENVLTEESAIWLRSWLLEHGLTKAQMK